MPGWCTLGRGLAPIGLFAFLAGVATIGAAGLPGRRPAGGRRHDAALAQWRGQVDQARYKAGRLLACGLETEWNTALQAPPRPNSPAPKQCAKTLFPQENSVILALRG